MKKLFISILILFSTVLKADYIEGGYHVIDQYKEITNCTDFPDITIVAYVRCVTGCVDPYIVTNGTILEKGYKFNSLYLLVFDTEAFNNAGGLSGFDFEQIINDNSITEVFSGWSNQISDNSVIDGEHIYYRISDVTASTVKMEFEKIVFSFNDGTADKTVTF